MHRVHVALAVVALVGCQSKQAAPKPQEGSAGSGSATGSATPPPPLNAPTMDVTKFARDCQVATDCVVVKRASCDPCACAGDAIASKAMAEYDEAVDKLACPPADLDRVMACGSCEVRKADCKAGQCVVAE